MREEPRAQATETGVIWPVPIKRNSICDRRGKPALRHCDLHGDVLILLECIVPLYKINTMNKFVPQDQGDAGNNPQAFCHYDDLPEFRMIIPAEEIFRMLSLPKKQKNLFPPVGDCG